ncbi:hypothetical protein GCM10022377_24410 [Zhihengliuella alba]|uniref:Asp23/Gls24 family envelope stress response protein n=1 Tax=Zhihengliuella alba TaxID=547018 RepID=A0ABP7DT48_9MICC
MSQLAGHTRISTQALSGVARAIASDLFAVPPGRINVVLDDDLGRLAIGLNLPLPLHAPGPQGASVWDRAVLTRDEVRDRFTRLTGSEVSRIDVRVTGLLQPDHRSRTGRIEGRPA